MSKEFIQRLIKDKKIFPPDFLYENINYLTVMGSQAYAVSNDDSDMDIYGFCTPTKEIVFPHTAGIIPGFGRQQQKFEQWQEHHIKDDSKNKEYDFSVYNIVKYFQLLMDNNPNIVDSAFVPDNCVLYMDKAGEHLRNNRELFLHKGSLYKFRGYAHSQFSKIKNKTNSSNPKRQKSIQDFGFDVKFSYHLVRLLLEAEQIAIYHTLDLQKNSEILKSIRRGEWSLEQLTSWFDSKMLSLESTFENSSLRNKPDESKLKNILIECLEMKFGSIDNLIQKNESTNQDILKDLKKLIQNYS